MISKLQLGPTRPHVAWWAGRAALVIAIVVGGYWLSLGTLLRDLSGQTPLAFIGLSPILALGLLVAGLRRREELPPPGRIDGVVGLGFIAGAALIVFIAPFAASIYFWVARLDMLSLPLYAAGALILLFGWRVLFLARGALLLLLLAWPLPFLALMENTSEFLTDVTAGVVRAVTSVVPMAAEVPNSDALFMIAFAPAPFVVQIATACAGLNSTVAFLLVGGAFTLLLTGGIVGKLLWLASGLVLIFILNIVRVVALIAVGAAFGERAALELFHPVAGMFALAIGLALMLLVVRRFGLAVPPLHAAQPAATVVHPARARAALEVPTATHPRRGSYAWRAVVLIVVAAMFGSVNGTFAAYEEGVNAITARPLAPRAASGTGQRPGPTAGQAAPAFIADRAVRRQTEITIGKPYFGTDSKWIRYQIGRDRTASGGTGYSMWLDSIRVVDRQNLVDFGVEDCYRFHGQTIDASEAVALGRGVVGRIVVTSFAKGGTPWVVLWWEWPVQAGAEVHHERLVLLASAGGQRQAEARPRAGSGPLLMFDFGTAVPAEFRPVANDLATFASKIVVAQSIDVQARR